MASIRHITVQCLVRDAVTVSWALEDTVEDLSYVTVSVWRSFSPSSEFQRVSPEMSAAEVTEFLDSGVNLYALDRDVFWRVQLTSGSSVIQYGSTDPRQVAQGVDPGGVRLNSALPSLAALEIGRRVALVIDGFSGQRFLLLRRRTSGRRCPECWDALKRQSIRSACPTCFSVGFAGGYYRPQPLNLASLRPTEVQSALDSLAKVEIRDAVYQAHNRVMLAEGDLVASPLGTRHVVLRVTRDQVAGFVTRQVVVLRELARTNVEYGIPIQWNADSLTVTPVRNHLMSTSLESYEEGLRDLGVEPPAVNPATLFPSTLLEEP